MTRPRQKYYRVWAYVEAYDSDKEGASDEYEPQCLATFDNLEQAKDYLDSATTLDPYGSLSEQEAEPRGTDQCGDEIAA